MASRPDDRRAVTLCITPEGKALVDELDDPGAADAERTVDDLGADDALALGTPDEVQKNPDVIAAYLGSEFA